MQVVLGLMAFSAAPNFQGSFLPTLVPSRDGRQLCDSVGDLTRFFVTAERPAEYFGGILVPVCLQGPAPWSGCA